MSVIRVDGRLRVFCCVPFCGASRGDRKADPVTLDTEWICSKHWPLVSKRLKRRRAKLRRLKRRASDPLRLDRIADAQWRLWQACKRDAIERAAGL